MVQMSYQGTNRYADIGNNLVGTGGQREEREG